MLIMGEEIKLSHVSQKEELQLVDALSFVHQPPIHSTVMCPLAKMDRLVGKLCPFSLPSSKKHFSQLSPWYEVRLFLKSQLLLALAVWLVGEQRKLETGHGLASKPAGTEWLCHFSISVTVRQAASCTHCTRNQNRHDFQLWLCDDIWVNTEKKMNKGLGCLHVSLCIAHVRHTTGGFTF